MVDLQSYLALGLLAVCVVNAAAFMLVRTLKRKAEFSLRRALGAKRSDIRTKVIIESISVGIVASFFGCLFALAGVATVNAQSDTYAGLVSFDLEAAVLALVLSISASLVAAMVPAWLVTKLPPATFLKGV